MQASNHIGTLDLEFLLGKALNAPDPEAALDELDELIEDNARFILIEGRRRVQHARLTLINGWPA